MSAVRSLRGTENPTQRHCHPFSFMNLSATRQRTCAMIKGQVVRSRVQRPAVAGAAAPRWLSDNN